MSTLRNLTTLALTKGASALLSLATRLHPSPPPPPDPAGASDQEPEAPVSDADEIKQHLLNEPSLESRRVQFGVEQIMHMVWDSLHVRGGVPVPVLVHGKWVWSAHPENNSPVLTFIRPGVDA